MSGESLVVVGVDGSEPARVALDFALEEAGRRSARVLVVTALQPPEYWPLTTSVAYAPSRDHLDKLAEAAEQATREAVAEAVRAAGASVPVETRVVQGNPARVLLDQAAGADLLVVGHRGRGAIASACLGSVSLQCVLYADCSVVVVRQARSAAGRDRRAAAAAASPA
jgi:nucleotide-binding universal stress UspA family protein